MDWLRRTGVRLLLVGIWTLSLLSMAYPARAQAWNDEGKIHIVAAGQTLKQIARQYGTDVKSLLQLNDLANPDLLYVGQSLVVGEGYQEQPRWENEEPQPAVRSERPAGINREPQAAQDNYRRAGVAWEPQPSGESDHQAGVSWEPQHPENNGRPAGAGWEPQPSQSNDRPAGTSWEPQPRTGVGREVEAGGEKWIDIDLSDQVLTAYQGDTAVRYFIISSGKSSTPTVTGSFRIYSRTELQDMSGGSKAAGDYYFQADVPWVQYFYQDYAIHGAYWHHMFGTPIGHGCINMRVEESRWLYEWTGATGARVEVHQ
jgi:lipoprotein-anchoring transpeptidase ErfK/SrfK